MPFIGTATDQITRGAIGELLRLCDWKLTRAAWARHFYALEERVLATLAASALLRQKRGTPESAH